MGKYGDFKFFDKLQYRNKCHECGKEMPIGSPGYGSNRTTMSRAGRWIFVCPACYGMDRALDTEDSEEESEDEIAPEVLEAIERIGREEGVEISEVTRGLVETPHEPKDEAWVQTMKEAAEAALQRSAAKLKREMEETIKKRPLLERLKDEAPWRFR